MLDNFTQTLLSITSFNNDVPTKSRHKNYGTQYFTNHKAHCQQIALIAFFLYTGIYGIPDKSRNDFWEVLSYHMKHIKQKNSIL